MTITLQQYERGMMHNGVACPQCGAALDDEGTLLYPQAPQRRRFSCGSCGFSTVVKDANRNHPE